VNLRKIREKTELA